MNTVRPPTSRTQWRRLLWNPITIKELRATFRQRRFLIVYWVSLALYSLVVLWLSALEVSRAESSADPVGQRLFNYCVAAQLALVLFVLPGYAATAITDERENQSFDLLINTALRAADIVWGKFLACMSYAFLFLAATFPLVCVSVLFTGVRPGEVLLAYLITGMTATVTVSIGLATSATGRSSRRAVAVTYAIALLFAACWISIILWARSAMPASYSRMNLVGYYYDLVFHSGWVSTVWSAVVPLVLWLILLSLLLIIAIDRLKPANANKSTSLRVLGVVAVATFTAVVAAEFGTMQASAAHEITGRGIAVLVIEAIVAAGIVLGAACEDPRFSRRVQREYAWASGRRWPIRLLLPGSASGLAYVLVLSTALLGGTAWLLIIAVSEPRSGQGWAVQFVTEARDAIAWTGLVLGAMVLFYAALARWCSTVFDGAIYTRTVVVFVFVMANLLPVCLLTVADSEPVGSVRAERPSTVWNLHYVSSFLSLRSAWDMSEYWPLPERGLFRSKLFISSWGINQSVAVVSAAVHGALGIVLLVWGSWRQRRVIKPHLRARLLGVAGLDAGQVLNA